MPNNDLMSIMGTKEIDNSSRATNDDAKHSCGHPKLAAVKENIKNNHKIVLVCKMKLHEIVDTLKISHIPTKLWVYASCFRSGYFVCLHQTRNTNAI